MSVCELILHLHRAFLASLSLQEKHIKRWEGLHERRMASHEFQKSSQKKRSVETEMYNVKGGMTFLLHVMGSLAYCQQMWWMLRVDVFSECNETGEICEGH